MIKVFVEVEKDRVVFAEISKDTYEILKDGAALRNRPMQFFLLRVVQTYGSLTEENILKYVDECWAL